MDSTSLWLLLVGLTALQRAFELRHSRRNLARLGPESRPADSRANWCALVVLQVLWLLGCAVEPLARGALARAPLLWTGLGLFAGGAALRLWCIHALGLRWNARARVDPALGVVTRGPYRWIRHPNYLGVLLELFGLSLAGNARWTAFLLVPPHLLVLHRRMRGEDVLLSALPGYGRSMGHKGALLPRIPRR
jgi:methyltransferase